MSATQLRHTLTALALAALYGLNAPARADDAGWFDNLDAGTRRAAETNRLLLVHFWAPWCSPCMQLEREVLSHRDVGPALDQYFVRVKLNYDRNQKIAEQFGVESLPCDLILTPQGHLVTKTPSPKTPADYVSKLTQAAASLQAAAGQSQAHGPPAGTVDPAAAPSGSRQSGSPAPQAAAQHAWSRPGGATNGPGYQPASPYMVQASMPAAAGPGPANHPPLGLDGYCPVQLSEHQRWVAGDPAYGAIYLGHTYLFAGPEEKRRFMLDPDRYSPVADGFDPVLLIDHGQQVPGQREFGVFYGERVYLFSSEQSLERFAQDKLRYAELINRPAR